jgi:hypothetical protein
MNTAELIAGLPGLTEEHRITLELALATSGKHANRLRDPAPDRGTFPFEWGVWQSVVGTCSIHRVDVAGMMLAGMGSLEMAGFDAAEAAQAALELTTQGMSGASVFRALIASTEPIRWNADYINYDMDVTRDNILAALSAREV